MSKFWYYLIAMLGTALFMFVMIYLYYKFYCWLQDKRLKNNVPKDKKELLDPGKPIEINPEEVKQDERRTKDKFRQFERLRRITEEKSRARKGTDVSSGSYGESERSDLPYKSTFTNSYVEHEPESDKQRNIREIKESIRDTSKDRRRVEFY